MKVTGLNPVKYYIPDDTVHITMYYLNPYAVHTSLHCDLMMVTGLISVCVYNLKCGDIFIQSLVDALSLLYAVVIDLIHVICIVLAEVSL